MQHLPLFADLKGRPCLVVGGGPVAERRVHLLNRAGAAITVIASEPSDALRALADEGAIGLEERALEAEAVTTALVDPYWLVVGATSERAVNAALARAAEAARRWCNVVDEAELCSFIMPAIIDREPITIAVGSGGQSPVLSRWLKGLIEAALPERIGALGALAGRWRDRAKSAIPDLTLRRRFWQHVLEGRVAEHAYAGRERDAETELERALDDWRGGRAARHATGEAYLVGAGPGSADLITMRGRQLLANADVVLYDRLVSPETLELARRDAELVSVAKTPRKPSISQAQINRLLVRHVAAGRRVCRLKGGDPMVFGRGGEELEALVEAGLPFQVVPGVSAVEGCAAFAGIPLTLRGVAQAVVIATGHARDRVSADLAALRSDQTLAVYMAVAQLEGIGEHLLALGHPAELPAAVIERGTTAAQRVIQTDIARLATLGERYGVDSPALLLIGPTASLASRYHWFTDGELVVDTDGTSEAWTRVG